MQGVIAIVPIKNRHVARLPTQLMSFSNLHAGLTYFISYALIFFGLLRFRQLFSHVLENLLFLLMFFFAGVVPLLLP